MAVCVEMCETCVWQTAASHEGHQKKNSECPVRAFNSLIEDLSNNKNTKIVFIATYTQIAAILKTLLV